MNTTSNILTFTTQADELRSYFAASWTKDESKVKSGGLLVGFDLDDIFSDPQGMLAYLIPKNSSFPVDILASKKQFGFFIQGDWKNSLGSIKSPYILDIDEHDVGKDNYSRKVYAFDIPKEINLRAGLTVHNECGTWSSWPTHEFESRALASPANTFPDFSEVFAFVTDPPGGWGLQTFVGKNGTQVKAIADREIVTIPISLHPVVGAPDVRMAYFWAYTNGGEKFTKEGRV